MNGRYLNQILQLNAKHALYHAEGKWYHHLNRFPGVLFDKNGYVLFVKESDYLNDPALQRSKDLFIKDGLKEHRAYQQFKVSELELISGIEFDNSLYSFSEDTIRVIRQVNIILRKKSLVEKIKKLYNDTCQVCGKRLQIGQDKFYSEVHHIIPLGNPYNGRDELSNMLCVCPNHHVQLDSKVLPLMLENLKLIKHQVSEESITRHNDLVSKNEYKIINQTSN